jgi:hypothetical protein
MPAKTLEVGETWEAGSDCKLTVTSGLVRLQKVGGIEFWVELEKEISLSKGDKIRCRNKSKFTYN